jgi:hypothetical protein
VVLFARECRELWDYEWKLRKGGPPAEALAGGGEAIP